MLGNRGLEVNGVVRLLYKMDVLCESRHIGREICNREPDSSKQTMRYLQNELAHGKKTAGFGQGRANVSENSLPKALKFQEAQKRVIFPFFHSSL